MRIVRIGHFAFARNTTMGVEPNKFEVSDYATVKRCVGIVDVNRLFCVFKNTIFQSDVFKTIGVPVYVAADDAQNARKIFGVFRLFKCVFIRVICGTVIRKTVCTQNEVGHRDVRPRYAHNFGVFVELVGFGGQHKVVAVHVAVEIESVLGTYKMFALLCNRIRDVALEANRIRRF